MIQQHLKTCFDNLVKRVADDTDSGFVFANLVDFDMVWGHRNDVPGFAAGLAAGFAYALLRPQPESPYRVALNEERAQRS